MTCYYRLLLLCSCLFPAALFAQESSFRYEPDQIHCLLLIPSEKWAPIDELSGEIAKYNVQFYAKDQLEVKRLKMPYLCPLPVFYVAPFKDSAAAMAYYQRLLKTKPNFMQMNMIEQVWPLSNRNFNQVLLQQSLEGYRAFFRECY